MFSLTENTLGTGDFGDPKTDKQFLDKFESNCRPEIQPAL